MTVGFKTEVSSSNVNTAFVSRKDVEQVVQSKQDFNHQGELKRPNRLDVKTGTEADLLDYAENTAEASEVSLCFATDTEAFYIIRSNALVAAGGGGGGLDKWVSTETYEVDDVIWLEADDTIYRCITDNSDATFTPAKWIKLSAETWQQAYENQASGDIELNATQGGINFIDHSTPLNSAFKVSNNDKTVDYIDVNEKRVKITDADGTFIVRSEKKLRHIEDFKVVDAATYFPTLTGTASVSDDTVTPIDGHRSAQLDFLATNDSVETIKLDVTQDIYKLGTIGYEFDARASLTSGDVYVELFASDGVTPRSLGTLDIRDGKHSYQIKANLKDADTELYAVATSSNGAQTVVVDNFQINLEPDLVVKDVQSQSVEYQEGAGYGSANTRIRYFNLLNNSDGDGLFEVINNSVDGFGIKALKKIVVNASYTDVSAGSTLQMGLTLNSTQLSNDITNQTIDSKVVKAMETPAASSSCGCSIDITMYPDDVLRPHTRGTSFANGNEQTNFTITATQASAGRIIKGQTSELDTNSYTPTFQGVGTVTSIQAFWKREGDSIRIFGRATAGTTTATEFRIGLPSGFTTLSSVTNTTLAGDMTRVANLSTQEYSTIFSGDNSYINASDHASSQSLTKMNGNDLISTGEVFSFTATVPVNELSASDIVYSVPVGDQTENNFNSTVTNTTAAKPSYTEGARYIETIDRASAGVYNITWITDKFGDAPDVGATLYGLVQAELVEVSNVTTSGCTVSLYNSALSPVDSPFTLFVGRSKTDYREPTALVANAAKVNHKTGGVEYETGELWNGQKIYARSYDWTGSSSSTVTLDTFTGSVPTGEFDLSFKLGGGAVWVFGRTDTSTGLVIAPQYHDDTGVLEIIVAGTTLSRLKFTMYYIKE